ncbi:GABA-specific permease [Penicillium macrosclerotiorum]|uniref:GABA-specific permease n=1 Tax=Penicillium macrosclerotiorum TaxID=303699 RepID=UPI0025485599|nr:GABA-specific permease [Penicillium macrosclerotiorum]KAJ5689567.1 GABA-specific permease [Penicillium macrosclerotiorum]
MADEIKKSLSRDVNAPEAIVEAPAEAGDMELLATLGYKQELRRHYSTIQIFAVAFSIMGLLPSIASSLAFSMPAGPVGMVWMNRVRWLAASCFIMVVGLAMADMASAMPTAGGLYFWTHYYSAEKWKNPLSFLVGYSNTLGLIGGLCSIDYGFANMLLSLISLTRDGNWTATRPIIYGTYVATVFAHGVMAIFFGKVMPKIQSVCIFLNVALVMATVIALPVGKSENNPPINSGSYVFGQVENLTTWPAGWTFMLAWLSPIWTIGAFDSCVHMSEEATHATRAVPLGIISSIAACGILGFLSMSCIAASMSQDIDSILNSKFGQPMAQIYYDALGKKGALGFMAVNAIVQFFMGLSIVLAASRQSWAFSRDGALPFSWFFRKVSQGKFTKYQPVRMVCGVIVMAVVTGLLSLIDNAAANALFSLAVAGNDLAWLTPILARLLWGEDRFVPGDFYTGKYLSRPIAWVAVIYMAFAIVLSMIPTEGPDPSPQDMNYTIVINGALWIGALAYYFLHAKKTFHGPQTTVSPEDEGKQIEAEAAAVGTGASEKTLE